ncbi:SusC/RagA family TonB-linked outer membrane protein [Sinomicrobium soli]|uniref:SusC/RagA family TonB-linked outer membrane protein n=1 Tax=Sinomicrobium sp. N-1-3-6 TaxID=2219864 RepID=UPI000DCD004F|nr:TonB-dependent receptor [Sinomicrobium sp. N-1-3-6]RAV28145.1 SusC/RagA family TonB-linked outer membrane protein [Sinomicrobium sp. N-1-3-6]
MKTSLMRRLLLFTAFFCAVGAQVYAQITVSGTVSDATGPLPGANIVVKGTTNGTQSDFDGNYTLDGVPEDAVLVFSYIGYREQEIDVSGETTLNVTLEEDTQALDEVVVVGYGTQRRSDLTGAVSTVSSESLQEAPVTNPEQALAGRAAGVNVSTNSGRPGGNTNVRIRGNNSINASNGPLYVVDGVIGAGPINYLNPNDIESMEVLKDASATAIYGARGANGVIIITTKRGSKEGGRVSYDTFLSIGELSKRLDVLNAQEFLQVEMNAYNNASIYDPDEWANGIYVNPMEYRENRRLFDAEGNPLYDTDWQKEAMRTAITQNHNLSFTGGNDDTSYGIFLNYADQEGIVKQSYLKRYSGRFVIDSQVKEWMKVSGGITFNHIEENRVDGSVGGLTPLRMIVETLPIIPVKYEDGSWGGNGDYPNMEGGENPVNLLENRKDIFKTQSVLGDVSATIDLAEGLELKTSLGMNIQNIQESFYSGKDLRQLSADYNGEAWVENTRTNYWQFENYLTYTKEFNEDHRLTALAGLGWQQYDFFRSRAGSRGFNDDFYMWNNLEAGSNPLTPTSLNEKWAMNSYFARVNYSLMNKYLFTVTGRLDGSSKFGADKKRAFFPSAAFAWKVSEEDFLRDSHGLSTLKLRTSYGETGNSEIGVYQSLANMAANTAILGGDRASGTGIGSLANPDLKWEKTAQFDAGVEFGFFDNRIRLETDFYYKKTTDMLLDAPIPTSSGYSSIYTNVGSMENKGFEISLNTTNIDTEDFTWTTSFNLSVNKNEILALGEADDDIFPNPWFLSNTNILRVGESVGSFYGLKRLGTWGADEASEAASYGALPGDIKHADTNGDGQINDADRVIIGNGFAEGFGALFNTFRYKNFDLTLDLQFMYGNDILNLSKHSGEDRTGQANSYATVLNGWTPDNQNTMIAANRPVRAGYTSTVDSRMVEDGSFIRGRNLILGYNFPSEVLDKLRLGNLRVYASLQNFFIITDYSGYDPEVTTYGDAFAQGITFFDYPKPRTYTIGLNVSF